MGSLVRGDTAPWCATSRGQAALLVAPSKGVSVSPGVSQRGQEGCSGLVRTHQPCVGTTVWATSPCPLAPSPTAVARASGVGPGALPCGNPSSLFLARGCPQVPAGPELCSTTVWTGGTADCALGWRGPPIRSPPCCFCPARWAATGVAPRISVHRGCRNAGREESDCPVRACAPPRVSTTVVSKDRGHCQSVRVLCHHCVITHTC